MMKRILSLLLCLLLPLTAAAEGWLNGNDQQNAVENVTTDTVYDAADSVGTVVNTGAPKEPTDQEKIVYSFTPLDVVLVLDSSGSMDRRNYVNNKDILSYAQDAAIAFSKTLFAINPASRVAVVGYDTSAYQVSDFRGIGDQTALQTAIRGIRLGGSTNTGGGVSMAISMLDQSAMADRQRVVLLLSDGVANVGGSDPVQYAVDQGYRAASNGLVYTIGLVGGMSSSEISITHRTLAAGYETRYFEVDFEEVGDITTALASAFMTIAMSGSVDENDETGFYRLWVDGSMDLYVENSYGEYLSSAAWNYQDSASFGSFYTLGDNMDEKMVVLYDDDYRITLHGTTTGKGSYTLTDIRGRKAKETVLVRNDVHTHPAMYQTVHLIDGKATTVDESYEPLDIYATDPFTGEQSRGLEIPALGTITGEVTVRAYPSKTGDKICSLKVKDPVNVLAHDQDSGFSFISFTGPDDWVCRGWVLTKYVKTSDYVPDMIWLDQPAVLAEASATRRVPSDSVPQVSQLGKGVQLTVRHAERDSDGAEWLYVQPQGKEAIYYIPAAAVEDWTPQTSEDFRIGYATMSFLWKQIFGAGYTEVMWAIPQKDGDGVLLSGRTTSAKSPFKKNQGERDAFAIRYDPAGEIEQTVTAGGSAIDSYHCIIPAPEGYYVSGITRSNDKDFKGTWDPASTTGKTSANASRSNALIGHLNEDLSIDWLKSFGSGNTSYGFDVVVQLADGNIAGAGWMTTGSKATIDGNGMQDFYVVKLSPEGEVLAEACFGCGVDDVPDSAVATPDGGLIMAGSTRPSGHYDGWILVLDSELNVVSQCTYGGRGEDIFDNVRALDDGTYLVTGFTNSPSGNGVGIPCGGKDFWAMNIDSQGRTIWVKRYGGSGDEELCGTTILQDGRCLLVGYTTSANGDVRGATGKDKDAWVVCIDQTGRLVWQYATSLPGNDYFNAATIDPADGCYVLAGLCNNQSSSKAQGLVVKLLP